MKPMRKQPSLDDKHRRTLCIGGYLLFALIVILALRRHPNGMTPDTRTVFTSTRYVTGLAIAPDGTVWAGTMGGVLQLIPEGKWRKYTRLNGLPSNEVRRIDLAGGTVTAIFPNASAAWKDGRWQSRSDAGPRADMPRFAGQTCETIWHSKACVATIRGIYIQKHKRWRLIPPPASFGTHISALCPHGDSLWAALFGDGLWKLDGRRWQRLDVGLPQEAREVTALEVDGSELWVGTRHDGVWERLGGQWIQHLQPDEPVSHDCQAIAMFGGKLLVSTLEDGLAVRTPSGWGHYQYPLISSDAPRQMVAYGNILYLRHGNGKIDAFDGRRWQRDVCAGLPRKQGTALAADAACLYVAQWGGWSEFDGKTWAHHLDLPALQGLPITALCPDGDTLWVGTQGRGIAEVARRTGKVRWHDERDGLPDDWITVLARIGDTLYAGTFVGGLARWNGRQWIDEAKLRGQNVTDLTSDGVGGEFIATRAGVWHRAHDGPLTSLNDSLPFLDREAQALCKVPGGLWIGTRTGLYFLP